jgi:hypothetical protein
VETIKVKVCITKASAVARNCVNYGGTEVELTDNDLAGLSEPAKKELLTCGYASLYVEDATSQSTCVALEAIAEKHAEEERKRVERLEEDIQKFLSYTYAPPGYTRPTQDWGYRMNPIPSADPRVQSKHNELLAQLQEAQTAWDTEQAMVLKASQVRTEYLSEITRKYVLENIPEYTKAAEEGCDVTHRALQGMANRLSILLASKCEIDTCASGFCQKQQSDEQEQAVPSNTAYEVRATALRIFEGVHDLEAEFTASFVRIQWPTEDDDWRTAVKLQVTLLGCYNYYAYILAE